MKKKTNVLFLLLLLSCLISSGCATMIRGTSQELSITSEPPGAKVSLSTGQSCITPCQMNLKRNQSLLVRYEKEGCEIESVSVYPTLAGGGVILGGLIDYGTGAVYDLVPNPCHAMLKCKQVSQAIQLQSAPSSSSLPKEALPQQSKDAAVDVNEKSNVETMKQQQESRTGNLTKQ